MANGTGGVWNTLMQQGFTPQQIQQLTNLGVLQDEGNIISQEMEMAQRLRERQNPGGQYSGRAFVAAHPFSFISSGIDRFRGEMAAQDAIRRQRQVAKDKAEARRIFLQQMGMGAGPSAGPSGGAMGPGATPPIRPAAPQAAQTFAYGSNPGTPTSGWVR